jgi:16S rRNA (cytosine967-C5)-methyltransferase
LIGPAWERRCRALSQGVSGTAAELSLPDCFACDDAHHDHGECPSWLFSLVYRDRAAPDAKPDPERTTVSRDLAVSVLAAVDSGGGLARDLLDRELAGPRRPPDARDRDLAREIVYGVLRRRATLDHLLRSRSKNRLQGLAPPVLAALRAGAYQLLFLDRIPAAAAVDAAVRRVRIESDPRAAGYANAVLRDLARSVVERIEGDGDDDPRRSLPTGDGRCVRLLRCELAGPGDPVALEAARWSLPPWIVRRWNVAFEEEDRRQCFRAAVARPGTWLRPLPGRGAELAAALTASERSFEEVDGAFLLRGAGAVENLPGYEEGWFVVQDPTAHVALERLACVPGESVLEIGAGRGGKTVLMAAAGARVTAVDRDEGRLELLRETLKRTGLEDRVTVLQADATDDAALPPGPFDAVLVDAPCSNTGVLARRVEARWRLRLADLEPLAGLGRRLLETGLSRLRPGGRAVHSVCSLEPEEGPAVMARALRRFPALGPAREERLLPVPGRRDGGWVGVLGG